MSIRQVQTSNVLEEVAKSYFASGTNPLVKDIMTHVSNYFAKYPPGDPLPLPNDAFDDKTRTDLERINDSMLNLIANLDVLYESSIIQLEELLVLNSLFKAHLDRLKTKRRALEAKVDDYLLSLYNTDGYFYSVSDSFSDLELTDLTYTSAFVDVQAGTISIPALSNFTRRVDSNNLSGTTVKVKDVDGNPVPYVSKMSFDNAVDGLTNTAWFVEVSLDQPKRIELELDVVLSTALDAGRLSRIDFTPFGIKPVQCSIEVIQAAQILRTQRTPFSDAIQSSSEKMTFINKLVDFNIETVVFNLAKTQYDYVLNSPSGTKYVYMFGAKEIAFMEFFYDNEGEYVSEPFGIPEDMQGDGVIDAVSVVVDDTVPGDTSVTYYVAQDNEEAESISDFQWKQLSPVGASTDLKNSLVSFQGALKNILNIKKTPRLSTDVQLLDPDTTNTDLLQRNPSPAIIPGADVYRIAGFRDTYLPTNITMEEGVNTTKILYINYDADAYSGGLDFWVPYINGTLVSNTTYGAIDEGHNFFYGGDVGESGKSVYVETFIESLTDQPVFLKEFRKSDQNARTWDVKVFLNGRETGTLPVTVDKLVIPWKLQEGKNHVALIVQIPPATDEFPNPYIGSLSLMGDNNLYDFGTVKLGTWDYVDFFKMQNNQLPQTESFTIYRDEIISRRKPTNNFRLIYSKPTDLGPSSIRFRASLARYENSPNISPIVRSYRLRFSYTA